MADRNYGSSFNQQKSTPVFNYVEDLTINAPTGAWRPLRGSDFGGSTTVNVSGIDTLLVDTDELEGLARSGNAYAAPASVSSSSLFTGSFGVSSAREVHSVFGYSSGNAQYLRVYDGTGVNGTSIGVIAVGGQNNFSMDYGTKGARTTSGIFVAFSSSPVSHVASGSDGIITIIWK